MSITLVDTHCHLNLDVYKDNVDQVLERARLVGVNQIVVPGIDLASSEIAVDLACRHESVYAAVGIHPNEEGGFASNDLDRLEDLAKHEKVVAIGEVGLDFHHHPENQVNQERLLESMFQLAVHVDKPLVLHSRKAIDRLIELIASWTQRQAPKANRLNGVFHAFEGNVTQAGSVRQLNFLVGIGGPVTYKNSHQKHQVVKEMGAGSLVLETDSPFLAPQPYRGQNNEPSRILAVAQAVANLLETSVEDVSDLTSRNSYSLFRWDEPR